MLMLRLMMRLMRLQMSRQVGIDWLDMLMCLEL